MRAGAARLSWRRPWAGARCWWWPVPIPGEDEQVLAAFGQLRQAHADCLLLLVPRHPERFDEVYELCRGGRLAGGQALRGNGAGAQDDILLGDTMGELVLLLGTATCRLSSAAAWWSTAATMCWKPPPGACRW